MVVMMMMMVDPKVVKKMMKSWEIGVIKKLETGWSLPLHPQNLTKEELRSIASDLFFLGNHYKYKNDDQKVHGAMTAIPFMDKVKNYWSVYNENYSTLRATATSTTTALKDYNDEQCNIKDSDLLCLVPENGSLNENMIVFIWHWQVKQYCILVMYNKKCTQ
eukprot:8793644-Ditylum_brightwellii.AAC.1